VIEKWQLQTPLKKKKKKNTTNKENKTNRKYRNNTQEKQVGTQYAVSERGWDCFETEHGQGGPHQARHGWSRSQAVCRMDEAARKLAMRAHQGTRCAREHDVWPLPGGFADQFWLAANSRAATAPRTWPGSGRVIFHGSTARAEEREALRPCPPVSKPATYA